jgi:putative glutamine amidotransferase
MNAPRIGITCEVCVRNGHPVLELPAQYAESVTAAGGTPLLLPCASSRAMARTLLDGLDGVVFSGGNDLDPRRYGERRHPRTRPLVPEKEASDFLLLGAALSRGLPILGICHGFQLINVARGGSLVQDIPAQRPGSLPHRARRRGERAFHPLDVAPGSLLHRILERRRLEVNTSHHQAVKTLGRGLRAVAWSPDGVIEGAEDPTLPFVLGVQWHPERLSGRAPHLRLFKALVRAASR